MSNDRLVLPPPPLSLPDSPAVPGSPKRSFVSRAGHKLHAALLAFSLDPRGMTCADLGANVGGFTDCLLQHGAAKVYAVDTAYGVIAWTLRKDPRVFVRDRTNAMHVELPEKVALASVDVGWTRQHKILPAITRLLTPEAHILTLIKPHYESDAAKTQRGVLSSQQSLETLWATIDRIASPDGIDGKRFHCRGIVQSPIEGQKGNIEYIAWLQVAP